MISQVFLPVLVLLLLGVGFLCVLLLFGLGLLFPLILFVLLLLLLCRLKKGTDKSRQQEIPETKSKVVAWYTILVSPRSHRRGLASPLERTQLLWVVFVFRLRCLFAVCPTALRNGNRPNWHPWCLAISPRAFSPFYVCRRFAFRSLVASLLATFWFGTEFVRRPDINLPSDW